MTTPGLERRARWWNTLYWRVGLGFVGFVVALLLVQSAIFIYWVDRPGERNPRHAQLLRVIGAAAALGDAFERGGPVDVAAIVGAQADRGGPLYVVLADGTALAPGDGTVPFTSTFPRATRAAGRTSTSRSTRRWPRPRV